MKKAILFAATAVAAVIGFSAAAHASSVVDGACVSVAHANGCLFDGNINGNTDPANANSFLNAQNAYNLYNNTHPSAQPDIALNFITKTDDSDFGDFGTFTGSGDPSGTWSLPGWTVNFIAVKASNNFVLYQITPASSGSWDTFDIPFNKNPHDVSHLAFFGTESAIPEPATWAMMIGGLGLVGAAMRRARRTSLVTA